LCYIILMIKLSYKENETFDKINKPGWNRISHYGTASLSCALNKVWHMMSSIYLDEQFMSEENAKKEVTSWV